MAVSDGTARTLIAGGQLAPVAVLSRQRSTLLPEVPTIFEVATIGDEQAWWLAYRAGLTELGRTLIAAPGTPDDRLAFLRQAIASVLNDPVVVAEAAATNRPISSPSPQAVAGWISATTGPAHPPPTTG